MDKWIATTSPSFAVETLRWPWPLGHMILPFKCQKRCTCHSGHILALVLEAMAVFVTINTICRICTATHFVANEISVCQSTERNFSPKHKKQFFWEDVFYCTAKYWLWLVRCSLIWLFIDSNSLLTEAVRFTIARWLSYNNYWETQH